MASTEKVALITGAGSGIGKATAVLLAQQGINVAVISNTAEEIQDTAAEIKKGGHEAFSVTADIG